MGTITTELCPYDKNASQTAIFQRYHKRFMGIVFQIYVHLRKGKRVIVHTE